MENAFANKKARFTYGVHWPRVIFFSAVARARALCEAHMSTHKYFTVNSKWTLAQYSEYSRLDSDDSAQL